MSEQSNIERQQKTANLLAAGNLWYQKQSAVALNKMSAIQSEIKDQIKISNQKLQSIDNSINRLIGITDELVRETKKQTLMQERRFAEEDSIRVNKENEIRERRYRKDAFFHLSKELPELESSKLPNLEKYFSIISIKTLMKKHNVSTELTDDLNEKKTILEVMKKLDSLEDRILKKFTEQDNLDLNIIFDILEEDEEAKIEKLNNEKKEFEGIKKEIIEIEKSNSLPNLILKYKKIILEME